mgnify:CR=1 FL=1
MILVRPHDSDWNYIAALTGDPSFRADVAALRPGGLMVVNLHRADERYDIVVDADAAPACALVSTSSTS